MRHRTVKHLCGHDAQYRLAGGRTVVEHHLHELERSPCTACATADMEQRRHIYLGLGARIVSMHERTATPGAAHARTDRNAELDRGAA